jgi:uncharacterized membrane protein
MHCVQAPFYVWFFGGPIIGLVVIVLIARFGWGRYHRWPNGISQTPLEIAQRRYASGEITDVELKTIKHNLEK